jgi:hypothetical protein
MAMQNLGQSYCIVLVYGLGVAATLERHVYKYPSNVERGAVFCCYHHHWVQRGR